MKKYKAVLESSYYGCDEEFEFNAPDGANEDELNEMALDTILENVNFYYEEVTESEDE